MRTHHHHHGPTREELRAIARDQERREQRVLRIGAERAGNAQTISERLAAHQEEPTDQPPTRETPISPLAVPMLIIAQFDTGRRDAKGHPYQHGAIDAVPAYPMDEKGPVLINATLSGRVLFDGVWDNDSGRAILIDGDDGRIYSYAHLASESVRVGERVHQGQTIAIMGSTGNAEKRKCLHYTVHEKKEFSETAFNSIDDVLEQAEGRSFYKNYKRVPPVINGREPRIGDKFLPGVPASVPPSMETTRLQAPPMPPEALQQAKEAGAMINQPSSLTSNAGVAAVPTAKRGL